MLKFSLRILLIIPGILIIVYLIIFFNQEILFLYPQKLPNDYYFRFKGIYEEIKTYSEEEAMINGLIFRTPHAKGLLFYLHDNTGSLKTWGEVFDHFKGNGYDILIVDYRKFGKSRGKYGYQAYLKDVQHVYNLMKSEFREEEIILYGKSFGAGLAAYLAHKNQPKKVMMESAFTSFSNIVNTWNNYLPEFIINYKLPVAEYLSHIDCPVVLLHGVKNSIIPVNQTFQMQLNLKEMDEVIIFEEGSYNDLHSFPKYKEAIKKHLN